MTAPCTECTHPELFGKLFSTRKTGHKLKIKRIKMLPICMVSFIYRTLQDSAKDNGTMVSRRVENRLMLLQYTVGASSYVLIIFRRMSFISSNQ